MSLVARGRGRACASLSLGAIHTHRFNAFRRHRMSQTVAARINELDDKQAIFQVKLLLQSAMDSTPDLMAMDDAAIATKLKAIDSDAPDTLAEAAAIMTTGSTVPLPTKESGSAAKEMLRVFAATPDGEEILDASLNLKDESGDFGLITFPLVCTF